MSADDPLDTVKQKVEFSIKFADKFKNHKLNEKWIELIKIRNICNISIEEKRALFSSILILQIFLIFINSIHFSFSL